MFFSIIAEGTGFLILILLAGYLIGMFQTGYFVGKYYGIDIREHGSKNAGMTNVNRTLGKFPALLVFAVDVIKACLAFIVVPIVFLGASWDFSAWSHTYDSHWMIGLQQNKVLPLVAGFGAILGHNFPFYLKFRGGKGIACTLGIILMLSWQVALISFAIGFVLVAAFRYISLSSLAITLAWPVLLLIFGYYAHTVILASMISLLAWFMHRENISRLISGTERRFRFGK